MGDLNKSFVRGRLGQDVDLRYTNSNTAVANLSIATSRRYKQDDEWKEETEWHRVTVWGKQAENAAEYLSKGSLVFVEGRLQTRKWEDKDGKDRYTTEIVTRRIDFLPSGSDGNSNNRSNGAKGSDKVGSNTDLNEDFDDIDDDLPF